MVVQTPSCLDFAVYTAVCRSCVLRLKNWSLAIFKKVQGIRNDDQSLSPVIPLLFPILFRNILHTSGGTSCPT